MRFSVVLLFGLYALICHLLSAEEISHLFFIFIIINIFLLTLVSCLQKKERERTTNDKDSKLIHLYVCG